MRAWMAPLFVAMIGCDEVPEEPNGGVADCSVFSIELLEDFGLERQLVLNLALAAGSNYESMEETLGLPDPETFRAMADGFEDLDTSGIEPNPFFDEPPRIIVDFDETADVLEDALAAGSDTTDPAWSALQAYYTSDFFVNHGASVNYYLAEADCI